MPGDPRSRTPDAATRRRRGAVVSSPADSSTRPDEWIGRARAEDIVVTADIPLAARCIAAGARSRSARARFHRGISVGTRWRPATDSQLPRRARSPAGPAPHAKRDRSLFLKKLDELIHGSAGR